MELDPDGGLSLKHLREHLGLDKCFPVSPIHWKTVEPADPDRLSPLAVMALQEVFNSISFVGSRDYESDSDETPEIELGIFCLPEELSQEGDETPELQHKAEELSEGESR
ncbi:hypothetical protein DXG01_003439 [Tephrocybe rancida]|nr:hypothetical protein DXG01_003439 [Tephrocybe rancida]